MYISPTTEINFAVYRTHLFGLKLSPLNLSVCLLICNVYVRHHFTVNSRLDHFVTY